MNKRDHLLAETLTSEDGEAFARRAAAHARHRRLARQVGPFTGAACVVVAAVFLIRPPTLRTPAAAPAAKTAAFEIMSDQELLAQLKDQPVLFLKGQAGITGVIFLADAAPDPSGQPSGGL